MKIRVLGCSGAIAKDCRTTSFLVDGEILIDAGTGVGDLTLTEMGKIHTVFLSHSHLDHVAALPLMVDAIASQLTQPLKVYALAGTIAALKAHVFNNIIWPDFTRIPSPQAPFICFQEIQIGDVVKINDKSVEILPAVHTVPAAGFSVDAGNGCWVFSGDTERNPEFWRRVNQIKVAILVIETAFSNREKELAQRSLHLSPNVLASELDCIEAGKAFPIYITHTKPAETELIMAEIQRFDQRQAFGAHARHDIRRLPVGQEFEI
ncbi:MAG: 3',5'-cyclic-nucleotide phosphodiesterase [Rhodoferax sp.]|nr:3',5'-cyclic-nucleotide phosphodiesterase [Rhodoferax sp.]MCF8208916.1 3',5'-cyclic-nucleotide phosphodiesterase [Rhodoferax sp.]